MKTINQILFQKKVHKILLAIKHCEELPYSALISKKADCQANYTVQIIDLLKGSGLVETSKVGRRKIVSLTLKGVEVVEHIERIQKALEE